MARNERPQWARLDIDGIALLADLAAGASLARMLDFNGPQLRCFNAPAATSKPLQTADFTGRVDRGGSCNCNVLTLTPHANGTHTECVGHLTASPIDVYRLIPQRLLIAPLLSIEPEIAGDSQENSSPQPQASDLLMTRAAIERAWPAPLAGRLSGRAAVIRTLPNARDKFIEAGETPAPFLTREAASWLAARGIEHLVLDVPSADRASDAGALTAHRLFFGLPPGSTAFADAQRPDCTLTELAYVPDAIADGWYFLSLQAPAIAGDAIPSRPVLYPLRTA
jgi:kynurenine formamidase